LAKKEGKLKGESDSRLLESELMSKDTSARAKSSENREKRLEGESMTSSWLNYEKLIFALLALIALVWVWKYQVLPIQDLPNHLAEAYIWGHVHSSTYLQEFFQIKFNLYPYLLQSILLRIFMIFDVDFAAKMFCSLALTLIPFGLYYWIKQIDSRRTYFALLAFPLIFNKLFFKGNLNFLLAIGVGLFFMGTLWKIAYASGEYEKNKERRIYVQFGILCALLYLSHLVAFALCIGLTFIVLLDQLYRKSWNKTLKLFLLMLPTMLLALWVYMSQSLGKVENVYKLDEAVNNKIANLVIHFVKFSAPEEQLWLGFYLMFWFVLLTFSLLRVKQKLVPVLFVLFLGLGYIFSPENWGDLVRPFERVIVMFVFIGPVIFAMADWEKGEIWLKRIVVVFSLVLALQCYMYVYSLGDLAEKDLMSARTVLQSLPKNKKLTFLWGKSPYLGTIGIGAHMTAYNVTDNEGYISDLFATDYMLVRYKEDAALDRKAKMEPRFLNPEQIRYFDAVFVWGLTPAINQANERNGFKLLNYKDGFAVYIKD
jgi:hypothetical protein